MSLSAEGRAILDRAEELGLLNAEWSTVEELRELSVRERALMAPPAAVAQMTDRLAPGPGGDVPIRVYVPRGRPPFPVVVFFHGGGWVTGSVEHCDSDARSLCAGTGSVVVSVDYRLAPEHPFPSGLEDCYSAARWAAEHAEELGGRPGHLVVAGDSAGGNLAAAVSLLANERDGPSIQGQLLIYPVTDHPFGTTSYGAFGAGCWLTAEDMRWYWDQYLSDPSLGEDAHASVLRADPHAFPPTLVITAGCDVLRDEGEEFANRLEEAGVPVILRRFEGLIHGFWSCGAVMDAADRATAVIGKALGNWRPASRS